MGRRTAKKKKKQVGWNSVGQSNANQKTYDEDTSMFITLARDSRVEGNKLFQKKDYEGAMLKYEKALNLLPKNHIDVAHLRANMAECFMQLGNDEYPQAIHQCNLALEVFPKYCKALLKRARCYQQLNKMELALRDVNSVLNIESNNLMALEISEKIKNAIGTRPANLTAEVVETQRSSLKEKQGRKKKMSVDVEEIMTEVKRISVKFILGDDIRRAQLPTSYNLLQLREVIMDLFPNLRAVLVKYKDEEDDLVTITTDEELNLSEMSVNPPNSLRLYIVEVDPKQDLFYEALFGMKNVKKETLHDDWIIQFARLFKNHVGFDSEECLDFHDVGMKLYSEAMEDTVTCEEAQDLFDMAVNKFKDMAALAFFNWGNVHMCRARKRVSFTGEVVESAYRWALNEYIKSGRSYQEALRVKPNFFEGFLALAQQQFEQARLSWCYAIGNGVDDLESWAFTEVIEHYNHAEENMENGIRMWEEIERKSITDSRLDMKSSDGSANDSVDPHAQINLLYGTMLYERSVVEFKLDIPSWNECLEAAVEKFELAGASRTDIAVMVKNHCSNNNAVEGLGFKIDEIVQAWNEMYEAKRWMSGVPSFRLEPLLRRRAPLIYQVLEHSSVTC